MKTIRLIPTLRLLCLGMLLGLAFTLPAAATSLKLSFTEPSSANEFNRQAVLEWNAEPARTYLLQSADALSPGAIWKTEEAVRTNRPGMLRRVTPITARFGKFYRLILPQPEVHSVEPSFVSSSDPTALLYLVGQCFPTNGSVVINGLHFTPVQVDTNGSWMAISLNGLPPGTPVIGTILVLDSGSNIVTTMPLQNVVTYGTEMPEEQLQGPPDAPPASPQARKGYQYYMARSDMSSAGRQVNPYFNENALSGDVPEGPAALASNDPDEDDDDDGFAGDLHKEFKGHVTLLKRSDSGSSAMGKKHTKTGHVTLLKRNDSSSARTGGVIVTALGSGEVQSEETDLSLRGRGHEFGWVRNHRSRSTISTAQGAGWDFSYNVSATRQPDGTVVLRPGNGRADTFYPDGTNGWTRDEYFFHLRDVDQNGSPDEVVFPDGGKWILLPPGPDLACKLSQIIDRNNNIIRCEYDPGDGRLVRVVDTLDRTNTVAYNNKGFIASVTDFSGRVVRYEYDSSGDLIACISPAVVGTPNGNDFPGGKTNRYTYSSGNLDERLNHNLVSVIDASGQTTLQITYSPTNNPASLDFDAVSSVQRGADKKDIRRGMVIPRPSNSFATVQTIVNDYLGNVAEYLFDSRQRCVSEREFTGRANPALPTTATENRPIGKLRDSDPDYFETRWEWNADSLCTQEIRSDGGSTEISHQRAQDHNSSRSNKTASRKHDGDVRIVRERASSTVDTDGDGAPDTAELASYFEYDPRFGSPAPAARGKKLYVGNIPFVTSALDARGIVITNGYDSNGNCTKSIKSGHYAVSNFRIEIDGVYNNRGQLTIVTNAADATGYRRVDTVSYYTNGPQMSMVEVMIASAMSGGLALATAFEYDPRGNPTNIIDPRGNNVLFTYNAQDQCVVRQTQQSSFGSRVKVHFHYDANDNLVRRDIENRDETGTLVSANPDWSTWFEYDALDRLTGIAHEISEGNGLPGQYATNRFVYHADGSLAEIRSPMAVSGADPNNTISFVYDERGMLFREISAPGSPQQCTSQFDYDRDGNLNRLTEGLEDSLSTTTFEHDGFSKRGTGKAQGVMGTKAKSWMVSNFAVHPGADAGSGRIRVHEGLAPRVSQSATEAELARLRVWQLMQGQNGSQAIYERHSMKKIVIVRLIRITDPMGNVSTFHYDLNDNLKVVRHYAETTDAPGGIGNRLFAETRFTYDGADRCVQQTDSFFDISTGLPVGDGQATTTFTYAPNGTCSSITDDYGRATRFSYDRAARLSSITDAKTNTVQLVLDACGNLISVTSSERSDLGQAFQQFNTVHTYDSQNRCIASVDNVGNTNRYAYDSRDNLVSQLDPRENEAFSVFDGLNRCVATTNYVGKERGITINTSHVEYDTNSRRTTTTDSNGNPTQYTYDSRDRCIGVTGADGTSCSLVWSPRSNLLRQQDPNGTVITNSYDLLDRCVSRIITPGPNVAATTTVETFTLDGFSRCVTASNNASVSTFAFDSIGNCIRSTQDGFTSSATFDAVGNCLSRTYPGGRVVTYTYNPLDELASVSSSAGGLPPTLHAEYAYEGSGRKGRIMRANGTGTRIQWNGTLNPPNAVGDFGWQQISRVTHATVPGNVLLDQRTFQHDRAQNTISRVRTPGPITPPETITLTYDALDRLTNYVRVAGATNDVIRQYTLDGNGNRQVVSDNSVPQFYTMDGTSPTPADFQMNQYTSTPFSIRRYDESGNLVDQTTGSGPTFYQYDYADRLVLVAALDGQGLLTNIASYTYDALGRRIRKTLSPGPTQTVIQYVHADSSAVIEERASGTITRTYIPEVNDEVLVAFNQAGQPQYYHYDDVGNTVALTDASGAVLERYDYDDYGTVTFLTSDGLPTGASSSSVGNPYCWGGLRLDAETRLHNDDGGDYFDPSTARWITSIGLPKVTPKISKESHGKFRMAPGNNPWSGASTRAQDHNSSRSNKTASRAAAQDHNSSRSNKTASRAAAQDHNSSRSNKTASKSAAQDHNSSRSNKTASKAAVLDHNSSRSNKTASSMAPGGGGGSGGGGGGGSGGASKLIVPIAMDKGLRFSVVSDSLSSAKHTKTGHVTLLK